MTDESELRALIKTARDNGVVIRTTHAGGYDDPITDVAIRHGIPGVGQGWMPPVQAAEHLRAFVPHATKTCLHCGWRYQPAKFVGLPGVRNNPYESVPGHPASPETTEPCMGSETTPA